MTNVRTTILIIEDELEVRDNLEAFLEDENYSIIGTNSAEDAFIRLQSNNVDIAIVDLWLPGIDGTEFMIEAHEKYPKLKFLIYTGSVTWAIPNELREIGIKRANLVLKPIDDMNIIKDAILELG